MRAKLNEVNASSPMAQQWGEAMNQYASLDVRWDHYTQEFAKLDKAVGELDAQFSQGAMSMNEFEQQLQKITAAAQRNGAGVAQLQKDLGASMRLLQGSGSIGEVAELYARVARRMQELGDRNEELGMSFARSAESLQAQAAALDTSTAAGERQAATLQRAAAQAQAYADRTAAINTSITGLASKLDKAVAGATSGKGGYDAAREKIEQYAMKLDSLAVRVEATARHEGAAATAREAAAQKAAAAAQVESQAERKAALQMEYGAMSRKQLIAAMRELITERQKAAAAGDAEAVQAYTGRISVARSALRSMNQELQLSRVQLLQKAQLGLQAAQSLQTLGQQAASGQMDVGSMASSLTMLGFAAKAGLGPVGAVLAAIQLIGEGFSWWNKQAEENRKKLQEAKQTHEELATSLRTANFEEYNRKRKEVSETELKAAKDEIQARRQMVDDAQKRESESAERRMAYANQEVERQRQIEQAMHKNAASLYQARVNLGESAAQQELTAENERHEKAMNNLRLEQAQNNIDKAEAQLRAMEQRARDLRREVTSQRYDEALKLDTSGMLKQLQEIETKMAYAQRAGDKFESVELAKQKNSVLEAMKSVSSALHLVDPNLKLGGREAAEWVEALREARSAALQQAGELERIDIPKLEQGARDARESFERLKEQIARKAQEIALQPVQLEGNYRRDDQRTQDEIVAADMERLEARRKEIQAIYATLDPFSEEGRLAKNALDCAQQQQQAVEETLARTKRAKGWERAQEGTLQEQQRYVREMLAATREGSEEWEKWAQQARQLNNSAAAAELERIRAMSQGVEGSNYGAQRGALAAQRSALQKLAGQAGLNAATQEAIRKELEGVKEAAADWKKNLKKSAGEGQKELLAAKAPEVDPVSRSYGGNVQRLRKDYEKTTQGMEKAAREGNMKELERLREHLEKNVRSLEALTGNTGKYAAEYGKLVQAAGDLAKLHDGLDEKQRAKKEVEEAINEANQKASEKFQDKNQPPTDKTPPQPAQERQPAPWNNQGTPPPASPQQAQQSLPLPQRQPSPAFPAGQGGAMPSLDPANQAAQQMLAQMQQLTGQAQQLAGAMQGVVSAAANAAQAFQNVQQQIASIKSELAKIKIKI